jgi:hypothetical protein
MEDVNPIVMVSLMCCVGPALWGGLFFALGRWSGTWRLALQRRSAAEVHAHSEAVGFSGNDQADPPVPREQQRSGKLHRRLPADAVSTTKRVD